MNNHEITIKTDEILSLTIRDGRTQPWLWYLDIHGQPIYFIGNNCGTCPAIFSRVHNAKLPLTPKQLSNQLDTGIGTISQDIINTVSVLLPKGRYNIKLSTVKPSMITEKNLPTQIGCQSDYFWLCRFAKRGKGAEYEIILPIVAPLELNPKRIEFYKAIFERGLEPTALAFTIHDNRAVNNEIPQIALVHFLLDGHHKVMAASQMSRKISLLSFERLDTYAETAKM